MLSFCLPSPARRARTLLPLLFCVVQALPASAQTARKHASGKASPSPSPSPTAASPTPASPYVLPDPVAMVDGLPIHKANVERVATLLLANQGRTIESLSNEDKKRVFASVLNDMINDRLVNRQAANEMVDPLEVEKKFSELSAQYPGAGGFETEIKKSGQTPEQVRENIRLQLAQQQWIERQIADDIKVGPDEALKFYKEGPPSKFDAPELVKASHILVAVHNDAPPEDALAAEKKANDLVARLKKGESFEDLAKANSDDPKAKENGGNLGYFSRERIMPEFADAAFKLKQDEISAPVRTQFGYHIIKVTDRKPAHTATFDEAHEQIDAYLRDEKRRAAVAKLLQKLRENAKIETFLP